VYFADFIVTNSSEGKVKWSSYRPGVAQRVGWGIDLPFHDRGTRKGWMVSSTPWPHFTPGKDPVPILQEAGCTPGPVWKGEKSRPHRDSIPDRPARSSVAISTELPGPHFRRYEFKTYRKLQYCGLSHSVFGQAVTTTTETSTTCFSWKFYSENGGNILFQKVGNNPCILLYAFFWVIPRRLNFICRRFGTLYIFIGR